MTEEKSCNGCKYAVFQDYGYSNYTVEGTNFFCSKKLHPENGFDRFYGTDKRLDFAKKCQGFISGSPIEMDCENEFESELTLEQKEIYNKAMEY